MRRRIQIPLLFAALATLAGCQSRERRTTDSAAAVRATDSAAGVVAPAPAAAAPAAAAPLSLAALAGKWDMRAVPTSGDSTPTTYVLTAGADTTGWTMTFPGRKPMPVHVSVMGDSLVARAGPYASVRRSGVQVTTESTMRLQGDRLVGETVAHYRTTKADSLLHLRTEGTRHP